MNAPLLPLNVFTDWFNDLANSMVESLTNARVDIVKELTKAALPTLDQLRGEWYMLALGGTYGLATKLGALVVVLLSLIMVSSPLSNHGIRVKRTIQSMFMMGIFAVAFFPLYSVGYGLVQAACQGIFNIALGKENSSLNEATTAMMSILMPGDIWMKVIISFLGMLLSYGAFLVAWCNFFGVLITGMVYPVTIALRPLGEKFNELFHGANSALLTTLVTPLIITFGLLLPTFAEKVVPVVGVTGIGSGIFTIIGALIALLGPIFLASWAFKQSHRVFARVDSGSFGGSVDVNSMPPVTSSDMDASVKESGFKAFASSMVAGGATAQLGQSDNLMGDVKNLALEAGAAAAATTGHPWLAAGLNALDKPLSKDTRAALAESLQNTPPPSGSPVDESWSPPTPKSNVVAQYEWPERN